MYNALVYHDIHVLTRIKAERREVDNKEFLQRVVFVVLGMNPGPCSCWGGALPLATAAPLQTAPSGGVCYNLLPGAFSASSYVKHLSFSDF